MRHAVAEVTADDALAAAIERAARTQHALILAEAQILTWKRWYAEAVRSAEAAHDRAEAAEAQLGEVEHGETEGAGGGAAVQRAADSAGPVSA